MLENLCTRDAVNATAWTAVIYEKEQGLVPMSVEPALAM